MPSSPQKPNILLITTDQQRWDALGLNDPTSDLQTPTLDALAKSGVNFTRAYSSCPVCIPARRSLLSGLHPTSHGLRSYRDGLEWEAPFSLPEALSKAGWQTELIGKLHLHPQRKRYGYDHMVRSESSNDRWDTPLQPTNDWLDLLKSKGITHPNCVGVNGNSRVARPWNRDEDLHHSSWLAQEAVDFITRKRDPSCPFFLHLSFTAPHPPLIPPQAYWDRYIHRHQRPRQIGQWVPTMQEHCRGIPDDSAVGPFSNAEIHESVAGYYGLINHIDDQVRYVLTRLFEYGSPRASEPTIIIFTTDHGEMLGDHQLWRKSLPYEGSSHIPLFISSRNMNGFKSHSDEHLVGLEDIAATVMDLCGLEQPSLFGKPHDSQSLAPLLRGQIGNFRNRFFGECGGMDHHFTVCGDEKYIRFTKTGEEQLFNLKDDPFETCDLSANTKRLLPHRQALKEHLASVGDHPFEHSDKPCCNRPPVAVFGMC